MLGVGVMTCVFDADTTYMLLVVFVVACVGVNDFVGDKLFVLFAIFLVHFLSVNEVG